MTDERDITELTKQTPFTLDQVITAIADNAKGEADRMHARGLVRADDGRVRFTFKGNS